MLALRGIPAALIGSYFALLASALLSFDLLWRQLGSSPLAAALLGPPTGLVVGSGLLFGPAWLLARRLQSPDDTREPFVRWLPTILLDRRRNVPQRRAAFLALLVGYTAYTVAFRLLLAIHPKMDLVGATWIAAAWLLVNVILIAISYYGGR